MTKTYIVEVDGLPTPESIERLRAGIELDDGPTKPAEVNLVSGAARGSVVEIRISEGRKRQVKRMLSAVGHPVTALHRVSFGPVLLGDLSEGETRALTASEVEALQATAAVADAAEEQREGE